MFLRNTLPLLIAVSMSACSLTNKVWPAYDNITIETAQTVNPDGMGAPSPIQVKIYELSSRATLDNLEFDRAFNHADTMLGIELLSFAEYIIQPGDQLTHRLNLTPKSKFVAVLAGFIDIDNAQWKYIYEIESTGHYNHFIRINENDIQEGRPAEKQTSQGQTDDTFDKIHKTKQAKDDVESILNF